MRTRRLVPLVLAAAVAISTALSACGGGGGAPDNAAAPSADATLDVRLVLEPTSLDITGVAGAALEQLLLDNVYETLLTRTDDGEIVPLLAESFEVSPDGLTYTFALVPDATFADGSPLTSADVVWSLDRARAADSTNPAAADLAAVASVAAPDPQTVVITLTQRDTELTYSLSGRVGAILKADTDPATLDATPNGSGPFTVGDWRRGSTLTLERNDDYWGEPAGVAQVVLHYIPDDNAAVNAQLTGDIDAQTAPEPTLLQQFRDDPSYTITEGVQSDKFTLGFNTSRGPLADPRVRHAIRQAIDKDGLIAILGGPEAYGRIGSGVAPTDPWYEDLTSIDAYDPDSARALLAEAGYAGGLDLSLVIPNIYPTTIGEYIASQLGQVGIRVAFQPVEFATWLEQVYTNADYDLSVVDHAEARDIANYANPEYYWRYDSPQVQQWATAATAASSDSERDGLYQQISKQISDDAASDWLYSPKSVVVLRTGVDGFPVREANSRLPLAGVSAQPQE